MATSHLEAAVRTIIASACGHHEPLDRDGLVDTPRRVSKAWLAMAAAHAPITRSLSRSFSTTSLDSTCAPPSDIIRGALFEEPDVDELGFVLVKDITFACLNRDTLLPMYGRCHVAYVPKSGTIIGLSKLSRVVSSVCSRSLLSPLELCRSVIDMIAEFSEGVAVVVRSNYGVFSRREGLEGPLFEEFLALVDEPSCEEEIAANGDGTDSSNERTRQEQHAEEKEGGNHVEEKGHQAVDGHRREKHAAIAGAVGTLLEGIGEDASSASSRRSASSYASWFLDATAGYYQAERDDEWEECAEECAEECVNPNNPNNPNNPIFVIPFTSQCEHHLLPFEGHVGIMLVDAKDVDRGLDGQMVERICAYHVERFSKRLQVQERLTQQIANVLWERLRPLCRHLVVLIECKHLCMIARGVQQHCSATVTQTARSETKAEGLGPRRPELIRAVKRQIDRCAG